MLTRLLNVVKPELSYVMKNISNSVVKNLETVRTALKLSCGKYVQTAKVLLKSFQEFSKTSKNILQAYFLILLRIAEEDLVNFCLFLKLSESGKALGTAVSLNY